MVSIDLRMNPIANTGAAAILSSSHLMDLETLNLSSCSFDESIGSTLLFVIKNNKTLKSISVSNNRIGVVSAIKFVLYSKNIKNSSRSSIR